MRNQMGWLAALLLAGPLCTVAADDVSSGSAAPNNGPVASACGGCKTHDKGPKAEAMAPTARAPGMAMMRGSEAAAERPRCKQRDTNCRLNELQRDNHVLEQRLDMMQKRMDAMARHGDAAVRVAPGPGGEPAPQPHQH